MENMEQDHAEAVRQNRLGNALLTRGRAEEAICAYREALRLRPHLSQPYNNLGAALKHLGRFDEAVAAYRKALELAPDDATVHNNLGVALARLDRFDEALEAYERAASLRRAGFEQPLVNQALLLMEMGETTGALRATGEALTVNPRSGQCWHLRSQLKKFALPDPDLESMERLLEPAQGSELAVEDRCHLHFALGKGWLDVDDSGRAFTHLNRANQLKRSMIAYDGDLAAARIAAAIRQFTPELLRKLAGAGHSSVAPVFVIGMPRSGTSLVEQVLASHPDVHGAGELTVLPELVPGFSRSEPAACPPDYCGSLAELSAQDLARLGREYEARSGAAGVQEKRCVDKMTLNFLYAGFIHLILPNARIIHCRRDAVDTCLSCYLQMFSGDIPFAFDLGELGLYYRSYASLMAHWRALLPSERFMEVQYEEVVADLEGQTRRLLGFCGLEWRDACRAFHANRRPVRTASRYQVRQPIYRTSVGRWKRHARHLGPLLAALEVDGGNFDV
jgi:Flp pilus assembly protein TadD